MDYKNVIGVIGGGEHEISVLSDHSSSSSIEHIEQLACKPSMAYERNKTDPDCYHATYDLEQEIGKGSYARVYRATHKVSKKQVALKVFEKDEMEDIDVQAARDEACYLKRLSACRQVIDLIDVMESRQNIVHVLPIMDMSLREYVKNLKVPLEEDSVRHIFRMIVNGVYACHAEGIMHCDLKLDNVLVNVGKFGNITELCIADFGLSSDIREFESVSESKGSLLYMAPEQLIEGASFDEKADVWSLGVILHELLFGRLPFMAATVDELESKISKGNVDFEHEDWDSVSIEVLDFAEYLLKSNP